MIQEIYSCYLNNQARSGRPETRNSEAVFQAIESNLASNTRRVSGKLAISQSSVVHHLHDLNKIFQTWQISPHATKILQNFKTFDSP